VLGGQGNRHRGLAEHRGQHAVVDRGSQRETAGEALADHPDALARRLLVEVAGQRAQVMSHRPVRVQREAREFPCHTAAQHDRYGTRPDRRRTRSTEQRRTRHGEPVVHQVVTQCKNLGS
jgi:hypothetical protein